jgi:hypothetical protein
MWLGPVAGLDQGEEPGQPGDDPGARSVVVANGLLDGRFRQLRTSSQSGVGQKRVTNGLPGRGAARQLHSNLRISRGNVTASDSGRFCCKSVWARWVQLFQDRAGAAQKNMWGSTRATRLATKDFHSRVAIPVNGAFSSRRLSRQFSPPPIFRLLQQNRPKPDSREAPPALHLTARSRSMSRPGETTSSIALILRGRPMTLLRGKVRNRLPSQCAPSTVE